MRKPERAWLFGSSIFFAVLGQTFMAQKDQYGTLVPALVFYMAAVFLFVWKAPISVSEKGISPKTELIWIIGIGLLILFFRLYRMTQIPPGMITEVVCGPWLGYAVPPSGWPPYFTGGLSLTHPDIPFWAWFWFHLFSPSHLSYSFFYLFFSSLAFPLGYLLFRDLAGPKAALGTLFFWGIMQWPLTLIRNGHPDITAPLYILGALMFARLALRHSKGVYWLGSGFFCGLGYYAYPLTRVCLPLLLPLFAHERRFNPSPKPFPWKGIGLFFAALLAIVGPSLSYMWHQQNWMTGSPNDHAFIGWRIMEQKSLKPLWDNFLKFSLLFNREASPDTIGNLPGRRLLDDVTGALFVLGFFLCLAKWKEKKYFYGIAGVLFCALPSILSDEPLHTTRILGMAPFIAYLAALAAVEIWERTNLSRTTKKIVLGLVVLAALLAVGENFKTYFWDRPNNEACWRAAEVGYTQAGQAIADDGNAYDYYLSPVFFGRFQTLFLGYTQRDHMYELKIPQSLGFLQPSSGRGLCFILQEGRTGVLAILQKLYPGGKAEKWLDPWGRPYLYFFKVPAEDCSVNRFVPLDPAKAWRGTYWTSFDKDARPVLAQSDPVLNFSYRDDFPVKNADTLRVEWRGTIHPDKTGLYRFLMLATDHTEGELEIDGKRAAVMNREGSVFLSKKDHRAVIYFHEAGGFENAFHLLWKPPGKETFEVFPPEFLR